MRGEWSRARMKGDGSSVWMPGAGEEGELRGQRGLVRGAVGNYEMEGQGAEVWERWVNIMLTYSITDVAITKIARSCTRLRYLDVACKSPLSILFLFPFSPLPPHLYHSPLTLLPHASLTSRLPPPDRPIRIRTRLQPAQITPYRSGQSSQPDRRRDLRISRTTLITREAPFELLR